MAVNPTPAEQWFMDNQGVDLAHAKTLVAQSAAAAPSRLVVPGVSSGNGGFSGSAFDLRAGQQGAAAQEWRIPVWRTSGAYRATGKRVQAGTGEESFGSVTRNVGETPDTPGKYGANESYRLSESDAKTQFGLLLTDPSKMKEWSQLALRAGWINPADATDAVALGKAWNIAVGFAVSIKAATKGVTEVTPFEAAKMVAQTTGSALLAQQKYAADHFTGTRVVSDGPSTIIDQRQTSQTGDVLHQLLGRNPTAGEKAAYQHGLNEVAAANPTMKSSVGTFQDGQKVAQTDTLTGGYDEKAAQIAQASAASPDVPREQQATTFYDALVHALGAAV